MLKRKKTMKVKKYFTKLVQMDSPSGAEKEVTLYLKYWLEKNGFITQVDVVGNMFASKNVNKKNPAPLLLCAHMDTVQPGTGIDPVLKNGVFTSKGNTILGADNKSSIAAVMVAIEIFLSDPENFQKPLEILFTVNEETGGGVDNFDLSLPTAKTVLICDYAKPIGTIVLGAPFIINFNIEFIGKATHASKPEKGINAFLGLTSFLQMIRVGSLDDGMTTCNIGLVAGGSGINTIPEKCVISGEVRSFKEELFKNKIDGIKKTAQKIAKDNKLKVKFTTDGYCPGYLYEESDEHIQKAAAVIKSVTGGQTNFEKTFGVSDGNILAPAGFKTILVSDGVKNPHTAKESVALKDMELLKKIIVAFLKKLPQGI